LFFPSEVPALFRFFSERAAAAIVMFSVMTLLFFYYLRLAWPEDIETRRLTTIAMAGTIVFGVAGVILSRYCFAPSSHKER